MKLVIPKSVTLPWGYKIKIRVVSRPEIGEDVDGLWDEEKREITICRDLPVKRKRYVLAHELQHAWLDWQHHCFNIGVIDP